MRPQTKYSIRATCYDKKGNTISTAVNSYTKSHPLQAHFAELVGQPQRQYLHAEIAALLKAKTKKVSSIFVERYDSEGKPALAEPCKICYKALVAFGVKNIHYTSAGT